MRCAGDGGTVWGQGGNSSAANGARDVISIIAATNGQKSVTVDIGGNAQTFQTQGGNPLSYFEMPFNGRTGQVTIKLNGKGKTGPAITNNCPPCGHVSFRLLMGCQATLLTPEQVVFNSVVIDV